MGQLHSKLKLAIGITAVGILAAFPVSASSIRVDVTVVGPGSAYFAGPIVTFTNLSDAGYQITRTDLARAFSDYIYNYDNNSVDTIYAPSGGTATPLGNTQLATTDKNDGCNAQTFSLTSFDPSDTFTYRFDPENNACQSIIYDFSTRFTSAAPPLVTVDFTGPGIAGVETLTGSTWTKELINPALADTDGNERFRLTLTDIVSTDAPEPGTVLLGGFGVLAMFLAKKRAGASAARNDINESL